MYAAGVQRLFVRMAGGRLYAADAAVSQNALEEAQKNFRGLSCSFAGDAYAVYPETLLFDSEALSLPVLKPAQINLFAAQSGTGLEDLLGAFGYTAYTDFYNEQDGTVRVFLDDTSTLRLNASGLVQYASTDGSATVSAYDESDITDAAALDAQLDCARLILDAAQRAGDTDTHASLYAVERSGEQTTLIFLQMYSGVPVLGDADFATSYSMAVRCARQRFGCRNSADRRQTHGHACKTGGSRSLRRGTRSDGSLPGTGRTVCTEPVLSEKCGRVTAEGR